MITSLVTVTDETSAAGAADDDAMAGREGVGMDGVAEEESSGVETGCSCFTSVVSAAVVAEAWLASSLLSPAWGGRPYPLLWRGAKAFFGPGLVKASFLNSGWSTSISTA